MGPNRENPNNDIAIIGMACRFPGANDYHQFWGNLKNGVNSIQEIPSSRWDISKHYSPDVNATNKSYSKWCGLLDNIDFFDNRFFNISPLEASYMDPHQRILLEETFHCIEDSGVPLKMLQEKITAVYMGIGAFDELKEVGKGHKVINGYSAIGTYPGLTVNKVSYFFGLCGPSYSVDAACASSLVALDSAKKTLLSEESDYALAGGISINLHPFRYVSFSKIHALSPDGQCKPFDTSANGYVAGDGVGILLLQRLSDAIDEGNHIHGIIKGTAINHIGKSLAFTAPKSKAQAKTIASAFEDANITPDMVTYIEAHGTGTSLGDPIEISGLNQVFEKYSDKKGFCKIGSVKSNVGHIETAAGVAGVIKVLLMMRYKQIVPTLNINTVNPIIEFKDSPFCLANKLADWKSEPHNNHLLAGVSSFGLGGVNSHVVLEKYNNKRFDDNGADQNSSIPFILSAKSEKSLLKLVDAWKTFSTSKTFHAYSLRDICATLSTGRQSFKFRYAGMLNHKKELSGLLDKAPGSVPASKNHAPALYIQDLHLEGFEDVRALFGNNTYLTQNLQRTIKTLSSKHQHAELFIQLKHERWPKQLRRLYSFVIGYVYISALIETGVPPKFVAGQGTGWWISLALSGIAAPEDICTILEKPDEQPDINLSRPLIPFYNPITRTILNPFRIDADYLRFLMDTSKVGEQAFRTCIKKARLLMEHQFSFKKYMKAWNRFLGSDSAIQELLYDDTLVSENNASSVKDKILLLVLIISSNRRLNQKWNLADPKWDIDNKIYEIVDLEIDGLILKDDLIALFQNRDPDFNRIARTIDENQKKLDTLNKPYEHLKKKCGILHEIECVQQDWFKSAFDSDLKFPVDKEDRYLEVGTGDKASLPKLDNYIDLRASPGRGFTDVLLGLWLQGHDVDWSMLFPHGSFQKKPLPVYPFSGEQHHPEKIEDLDSDANNAQLHPLLHQNTSDIYLQRFRSTFTGQEFFLADHVIKGRSVLPGVAYLEMVRAAVVHAVGAVDEGYQIIINNVVWPKPIDVQNRPVNVHIGLVPKENGDLDWKIYSLSEEHDSQEILHCQGNAVLGKVPKLGTLDIEGIKSECCVHSLSSAQCYRKHKTMGLELGPSFQGIEKLYVGQDKVLSKIALPPVVQDTKTSFVLHPSLMDAALQSFLGLFVHRDENDEGRVTANSLALPFAMQSVEIISDLKTDMWVLTQFTDGLKTGSGVNKMDFDLCDRRGHVCVRIKGLSMRELEAAADDSETFIGPLILSPRWKETAIVAEKQPVVSREAYAQHLVLLCGPDPEHAKHIDTALKTTDCHALQAKDNDIARRYETYAVQVFEHIQHIVKTKPRNHVLIQVVVFSREAQYVHTGLVGLLKTAMLEHPKLIGQLIEMPYGLNADNILKLLKQNIARPKEHLVRFENDRRYVAHWREINTVTSSTATLWKNEGNYLISGGAGGLGLLVAKEIAGQTQNVTLFLTGRSPLNRDKREQLRQLGGSGARIEYRQIDVTHQQAVTILIQEISDAVGGITGIIHCAGILSDNFIQNKTVREFKQVLAPKVQGVINLDHAGKDLSLDFFICFSSVAGAIGSQGQADYACANAFMDAYAHYRNGLVAMGRRKGHTLSVNWPLWKSGGMQVDASTEKMLAQNIGMVAMETQTGIRALYQAMTSGQSQVMVMHGRTAAMREIIVSNANRKKVTAPRDNELSTSESPVRQADLIQGVQDVLLRAISILIKVKTEDLDADSELNEYGFDSITLTELANQLNEKYGLDISPTIFFEYRTISSIAQHLSHEHSDVFKKEFSPAKKAQEIIQNNKEKPRQYTSIIQNPPRIHKKDGLSSSNTYKSFEPIAIVGMSGRFPQAGDVQTFWENLLQGKDCIEQIPMDRWDWKAVYGDPLKSTNKTNIKWGGFIEGVDMFDPLFFGISPKEAQLMDPQQRLLMTFVWKAIEDAGHSAQSLSGTQTGIFVGTADSGYSQLMAKAGVGIEAQTASGTVPSMGPNRMSYFLNIHGPSEPIETACSSSLVALHRAVEAIRQGNCENAVAGGINTMLTPVSHISFSKAGMLCKDGRCKTFSDQANGYVRGEGVGMLVLKRLTDAEQDRDHIYGVIRGSAVNHGGNANSLTAPNPKAQAQLLRSAYINADVDPRTVSYIEAHGTGTKLGDPIEIDGLNSAFKQLNENCDAPPVSQAHCGLGSVKSNIGHLELAAGVAGVIKVLLQLKHKTLVKSLHCDTINPYFKLKDSPFYIVRENKSWAPLQDTDGQDLPRRAGVSSFGFGGVNAHVVLEEYIDTGRDQTPITVSADTPLIIVLSAKNEERLKVQAQQLLAAVTAQRPSDSDMVDIAYTLQIGREAMDARLAMVVRSVNDLLEKLKGFIAGKDDVKDLYRGQVIYSKDPFAVFSGDKAFQETIEKWIEGRKYRNLLDVWVRGLNVDWTKLYGNAVPYRTSLPTYPFEQIRYWIPEAKPQERTPGSSAAVAQLHPLLHQNTSDLYQQRFSSNFSGREFFLAEHIVNGQPVLPGVAYLEMVRAAVHLAVGSVDEGRRIIIKNVVWANAIAVSDDPVQVHVGLFPQENGSIDWKIYSRSEEPTSQEVVYSQGAVVFASACKIDTLNIRQIKTECRHRSLSPEQCYDKFKKVGLELGPAFHGIKKLYLGQDRILAKLSLPTDVKDTIASYVLHPSLMDAALQSLIGLFSDTPRLPFALEQVDIISDLKPDMWAVAQYADGAMASDRVKRMDIDLCDRQGRVSVRFKGFSLRELGRHPGDTAASIGRLILHPRWEEKAYDDKEKQGVATVYGQHLVLLCESDAAQARRINAGIKTAECHAMQVQDKSPPRRFEAYALQVFEHIQRIIRTKPSHPVFIQVVVFVRDTQHVHAGLGGLLKTAMLEHPKFIGQVIEMPHGYNTESIIQALAVNIASPMDHRIRYENDKRYVALWRENEVIQQPTLSPWKNNGVYLITGGAGGLGMLVAKEIAGQARGVTLILAGRSKLSRNKQGQLNQLSGPVTRVEYKQIDVTRQKAVTTLIREIRDDFGGITGIIHGAGIISDNYIANKTSQAFYDVLAPKVRGVVNLDHASKDLPLDFFIFFSSVAGVLGNPGQADYACANGFMDAYADYRNELAAVGQRHGQTLSINWPLWKSGGMQVDASTEEMMLQNTGMVAMAAQTGIRALYLSMASNQSQAVVMHGRLAAIRERFLLKAPALKNNGIGRNALSTSRPGIAPSLISAEIPVAISADHTADAPVDNTGDVTEKVKTILLRSVSKLLNLRFEQLDADKELDSYGFESILLTQFTNQFNKQYHLELSPTVFFQYSTISKLAQYLTKEYSHVFVEENDPVSKGEEITPNTQVKPEPVTSNAIRSPRFLKKYEISSSKRTNISEPIAIVGMSGRFPQAGDVQQFWGNLVQGKDCIEEIPADRWDWKALYGDPLKETNKTNIKWGGFIEGVDQFDPLFFGISPKEARFMDPQQRLLMTYVWKAIEDAGYSAQSLSGSQTGIFVGTGDGGYSALLSKAGVGIEAYSAIGMVPSVGPNRMSYFLNFHGPSEPIETACSSALIAIHRAVSAIKDGSCDMAVAGGVNTMQTPDIHISFSKAGMLCEDGRCKTFSDQANGYVRGEGVGMLVLRKLKDARQDGDHIYGIIRGTAQNHGGRAKSLTAPNPIAQAQVLRSAYINADVDPRTVGYIEAHGTGTQLGDPVEIDGLKAGFDQLYKAWDSPHVSDAHCGLGSVKTNIGHLELAAGIAGVIKVLLQMKHKTLVKSLHCETVNPLIQLNDSPFYIVRKNKPWTPIQDIDGQDIPRRAGVSSFGFGGAYAHVVLEEYVDTGRNQTPITVSGDTPVIIVLSAKNEDRLKAQAQQLLAAVKNQKLSDSELVNMAYTLQVGRDAMDERLAIIVSSVKDLKDKLKGFLDDQNDLNDLYRGQVKQYKDTIEIFAVDNDLQKAMDAWVANRKYDKLSKMWVRGLAFDWDKLYGYGKQAKPRRMSLPTYPFEGQRFWVPETKTQGRAPGSYRNITHTQKNKDDQILKPSVLVPAGPHTHSTPDRSFGSSPVALAQYDQGVYRMHATDARGIADGIQARLAVIEKDPKAAVLLLMGGEDGFFNPLPNGDELKKACLALIDSDVPVIAVMDRDCNTTGILLGLCCDIMILSQESRYQYRSQELEAVISKETQTALVARRFGRQAAGKFIHQGIDSVGHKLKELTMGIQILPRSEITPVVETVVDLLIGTENNALRLLKNHMCKDVRSALQGDLTHILVPGQQPIVARKELPQSLIDIFNHENVSVDDRSIESYGPFTAVNLDTDVIRLKHNAGGVLLVEICDKENKNMLSERFYADFDKVFGHIEKNEAYKVVVLTGYDQYFISGGTKAELIAIYKNELKLSDATGHTDDSNGGIFSLPLTCKIPVIAAMQGHTLGAGWPLGMLCDFQIFSKESYYICSMMKYGFTPGAGATRILPYRFGTDLGNEMLYTARTYKGIDLIDRKIMHPVRNRSKVVPHALGIAEKLSTATREQLMLAKRQHNAKLRKYMEIVFEQEQQMHDLCFVGNERVLQRIEKEFLSAQGSAEDVGDPLPSGSATKGAATLGAATQNLSDPVASNEITITAQVLEQQLAESFADALLMQPGQIDTDKQFIDLGMDSIVGVEWVQALNKKYHLNMAATKVYDYANIREMAKFLEKEMGSQRAVQIKTPPKKTLAVSLKQNESRTVESQHPFKPSIQSTGTRERPEDIPRSPQDISPLGDNYGLVLAAVQDVNSVRLEKWEIPPPSENEVKIRVKASAINFPDSMCVRGLYPTMPGYPFVPGFEVAGVVAQVGKGVSGVKPGDEVMAVTGQHMGGHASVVNVPEANLMPKPKSISFEQACSLPVVFATVHYAFELGRLAAGEHVLIQTATGGCGLMALQLARLKGCICYGTSSRPEKLELLKRLGVPHVLNYKASAFDREIMRMTDNKGVDVVLNMLSGDGIQGGLNCLGPSGRYLEIAVHALKTSARLDFSNMVRNQSFHSIDLRRLAARNSGVLVKDMLRPMESWLASKKITPIVSRIYPIQQIAEAMDYVSKGQHIGKVVISHTRQTMADETVDCIDRLLEQKQIAESRSPETGSVPSIQMGHAVRPDKPVSDEVAVIGMSGQFPQSKTLDDYWNNLSQAKNCVTQISPSRWSLDEYYHTDKNTPGKTYCKWMGALEDVDLFDPLFFNISPADAERMDPQQRLFLENAWHCIEDAGYRPKSLSGRMCGVFVGCGAGDYGQDVNIRDLDARALTGGSSSILSARISYLLNLKGPCLAIDTACSSSLVAMAEACNSLVQKTSDLALAGGVSILTGPALHIMTSNAGMLSEDGRCFTFDQRANGFVPGEGVGVVLLKRLSDAIRDKDQIHGVIKGWGINQDGRTNGITAPSVNSQISLEKAVYNRFDIDPETISMVEAHGTGTRLGDPVEVEALTTAFQHYTEKKRFCALGSVKSNIGHSLEASGIAGVIKVLLCLRHKMLPPTINFENLNEHIRLDDGPFFINTALTPWKADRGGPRCAAVSSFGFSGTNSHVVIQEHMAEQPPVDSIKDNAGTPVIVVLSAKNAEGLKAQANQLRVAAAEQNLSDLDLADMAYTLQVGRDAMEERLALVVKSIEELVDGLQRFVNGQEHIDALYYGQVKRNNGALAVFASDSDLQKAVDAWVAKGKYLKLAQLWVNGLIFDWNNLYGDTPPRRMSLPTYPFQRKRYWIQDTKAQDPSRRNGDCIARVHPLLHENTSDFYRQGFSSTFSGREFFFSDHVVDGQKVLPDAAYLEIVTAAVMQAQGAVEQDHTLVLKNVAWISPVAVNGQPAKIHIDLLPQDNGEIAWQIYSRSAKPNGRETVHSKGVVVHGTNGKVAVQDIEGLKAQCDRHCFTTDQCYDAFKKIGMAYGPAHQAIEKLYIGKEKALAKLTLPPEANDPKASYVLHPALMNAALQTSLGLMMDFKDGNTFAASAPLLPIAMQAVEILGDFVPTMWALAQYTNGVEVDGNLQKLDIDLCDNQGKVCVRVKGVAYSIENGARDPHAPDRIKSNGSTFLLNTKSRQIELNRNER